MAVYATCADFKLAVANASFRNRGEFLYTVKFAKINDTTPYPQDPSTLAVLCAQSLKLMVPEVKCPCCDSAFELQYRKGFWVWRGPRYDDSCAECKGEEMRLAPISFLKSTHKHLWLEKLDVLVMWIQEYSSLIILREFSPKNHHRVTDWIKQFQQSASAWTESNIDRVFDGVFDNALQPPVVLRRFPDYNETNK